MSKSKHAALTSPQTPGENPLIKWVCSISSGTTAVFLAPRSGKVTKAYLEPSRFGRGRRAETSSINLIWDLPERQGRRLPALPTDTATRSAFQQDL